MEVSAPMLMSPLVTTCPERSGDTKRAMITSLSPLSPLSPLLSREYKKISRARVLGKVVGGGDDSGDKLEFTVDNRLLVEVVTEVVTSPLGLVTQADPSRSAGEA